MKTHRLGPVVDGLKYAEGLRWHEDRLWFSDMLDDRVYSWSEAQGAHVEFSVKEPSGLGFLPDGRVAIVGRGATALYAGEPGREPTVYAPLAGVIGVNDLVTDPNGLSYVGSLGKRYEHGDEHRDWSDDAPGRLLLVAPDGTHRVAAERLACPNGMVITDEGRTLVVAETYTSRLVAFTRLPDGELTDRRVVAAPDVRMVDGLTADASGAYWVGTGDRFVRVDHCGEVVDSIEVPGYECIACMLGGTDRRTLFLAVCQMTMETFVRGESVGRILACDVDVPGCGLP